jgi:hypothetical protein
VVVKIKQTWWHTEDIYSPNIGKKIRQVMDIYSDKDDFEFLLDNFYFLEIRIMGRNSTRREIGFIEKNDVIVLNLDINSFPSVQECDDDEIFLLHHAKIEIEYIIIKNVHIEDYIRSNLRSEAEIKCRNWYSRFLDFISRQYYKFIDKIIIPKKLSSLYIKGKIQPEVYITVPKGWKISGNSFFKKLLHPTVDHEGEKFSLDCSFDPTDSNPQTIRVYSPFVNKIEGKRKYSYLAVTDDLKPFYNDPAGRIPCFNIYYQTEISIEIAAMAFIPYFFLILSSVLLVKAFVPYFSGINSSFILPYLVILMSYSIFYGTLVKEDYDIPHKYWFTVILIYSLIVIVILLIIGMKSEQNNPENIYNLFVNIHHAIIY